MYKILIVEDEELERTSMKIFLEENLLDVEIVGEAKSGFEAVEMIDSKDINLLLVDINIPGIDGMEVIKYAILKSSYAVVIIITAFGSFFLAYLITSIPSIPGMLISTSMRLISFESIISTASKPLFASPTISTSRRFSSRKIFMEVLSNSSSSTINILYKSTLPFYSCTNGTFIVTFVPREGLFSLSMDNAYSFPK